MVSEVRHWRCKFCGWSMSPDAKRCASCNKMKSRKKKEPLPRSSEPHQCILLSMDTANVTGWAIRICGALESHGEHKLYTDGGLALTQEVCDKLTQLQIMFGLPIVAVSERSWGVHMGLTGTMAFGYWVHALRSIGVPMGRLLQVYPATWRAIVLPPGMASAKREIVRPVEMEAARALVNGAILGEDEAPAIMIGEWGARAGEVGKVLS